MSRRRKKALNSTFSSVSQHSLEFLVCVRIYIENVLLSTCSYLCYAKTFNVLKNLKKSQQRAKKINPKQLLSLMSLVFSCVTNNILY